MTKQVPFVIGGHTVAAGHSELIDIPISSLSNRMPMSLPVKVINGKKSGPVLFVSAAIHGDEIIGVEIIRRLAQRPALKNLSGTLLLVPVVNGYGFLNRSRYLPDRRDLNRSFPGSEKGSLAARLAEVFLSEIVNNADLGIDLHSAAIHRANLPQIRISDGNARTLELAHAFGAPGILFSNLRDGSLRQAADEADVPVLLFEGGEGLRFDEQAVRAGLAGILRVMKHIGMVQSKRIDAAKSRSFVSRKSYWMRAPEGGVLRLEKDLGDSINAGDTLGHISDLFGEDTHEIKATHSGIIVGRATLPIVNEGDAIAHIAKAEDLAPAADSVDAIVSQLDGADMFYEDEII